MGPAALHRYADRAAAALVKPGGKVYVTQTYQRRSLPGLGIMKPLMKYLTTIDFGQLTFEADIVRIFTESGLKIEEHRPMPGSIDSALQVATLSVLQVPP